MLSVGGWGADGFSQAASTAEGRALFAETALALMQKHGFLGLDVDWEYPGSSAGGIASSKSDKQNFTLLLRELRSGLDALTAQDGKTRRLCIAVSGDPAMTSSIECAAVAALVDQVNVMTYDLQTVSVASHHTALYSAGPSYPLCADSAVSAYAKAGIPKAKLMLGAAFYGHVWTTGESEPLFVSAKHTGTLTYKRIREMNLTELWDEKARAPFLMNGQKFISFDSVRSIREKGAYVHQNGLMGLMTWELGGDADGELTQALIGSVK